MKKYLIIYVLLFFATAYKAQDADFTKQFINQTHITLNKVQKEIIRNGSNQFVADFKNAILLQTASVKAYDKSTNESYTFSYKSREICIRILEALNPTSVKGFSITDIDRSTFEKSKSVKESNSDNYITAQEKDYLLNLNISEPGSILNLLINLN